MRLACMNGVLALLRHASSAPDGRRAPPPAAAAINRSAQASVSHHRHQLHAHGCGRLDHSPRPAIHAVCVCVCVCVAQTSWWRRWRWRWPTTSKPCDTVPALRWSRRRRLCGDSLVHADRAADCISRRLHTVSQSVSQSAYIPAYSGCPCSVFAKLPPATQKQLNTEKAKLLVRPWPVLIDAYARRQVTRSISDSHLEVASRRRRRRHSLRHRLRRVSSTSSPSSPA